MALVPAASGAAGGGAPLPPPEAIASVPAAPGSRLFFTWGAGTQLNLCELGAAGTAPCASTVAWSAPTMEQRRIAYDVLPLYRQLRHALQRDDGAPGARLALLRSYAASVRQILMSGGSDSEDGGCTMYEAAVWHMLELFFLEPEAAEGFFAELYASWLRSHGFLLAAPGTPSLGERVEELRLSERIEADPGYWPVLQRLLAIGQLEAVGELLLAHPAYAAGGDAGPLRDALDRVYQLLRTVPRLRRPSPASSAQASDLGPSDLELLGITSDDALAFRAARGAWARRARALLSEASRGGGGLWDTAAAADPAAARGLRVMVSVMLGDERALRDACGNWAELLAGLLFWRYTDASPQLHLGQLLGSCVEQIGAAAAAGGGEPANDGFLAFLRELLSLGSQLEVQGVVRLCTNSEFCGLWFVAHAYDVLRGYPRADALISRPLPHLGCDQSEMYTLHYVETLLGGDGTWQVAAEYLAWCPAHGADAMEALLARLPMSLDDAPAALKALALCDRHGLASAARALCARLSARASEAGLPGAALQWALRGSDAGRCSALVAPVVAKLAAQLEQLSGSFEALPLDLPELDELAPLLDCLPPLAGWDGQTSDSLGSDAQRFDQGFDRSARAASARRHGEAAGAVAYPELQLLRSFLQLQVALRTLRAQHEQQAAALARDESAAADADARRTTRARAATAAADSKTPAALAAAAALAAGTSSAALRAAYQAARRPVMDLLGLPLAPPPLRLPLLRFVVPLLETSFMPFSHSDVQRLLTVLGSALAAQAAARADGTPADGSAGSGKGVEEVAAVGGGKAVGEVRLALARALARAHIREVSAEA